MCANCWENYGEPANWTPEIAEAVGLVRELYEMNAGGGPLHVVVDDWNIDGNIVPWYDGWSDADLDALYIDGWPIADLPPEAPAVMEGLGRSIRQVCDRIAELMNGMSVDERSAMLAYHDGFLPTPAQA